MHVRMRSATHKTPLSASSPLSRWLKLETSNKQATTTTTIRLFLCVVRRSLQNVDEQRETKKKLLLLLFEAWEEGTDEEEETNGEDLHTTKLKNKEAEMCGRGLKYEPNQQNSYWISVWAFEKNYFRRFSIYLYLSLYFSLSRKAVTIVEKYI